MKLMVDIQIATEAGDLPSEDDIQRWVGCAVHGHQDEAEVTVRIVDEAEIRQLNAQYRGKDYATNVLSFPADLPPDIELPLLGDIVICAQVVAREALEQGKTPRAHWAHMLIHGTLHLLGYDHIEDQEAEEMEALETELLHQLGFPPPYENGVESAP